MTARYNYSDNTLIKESGEKISCHPSCKTVWKEGDVLEEGKDYGIMPECDFPGWENWLYAYHLVPPVKEQENEKLNWIDVFLKMHIKAQEHVNVLGCNHPGLPPDKGWHEQMIAELQNEYTITRKQ